MVMLFNIFLLISASSLGALADLFGPLSEHFLHHLHKRPKRNENLIKSIMRFDESGSFGGKMFSDEKIANTPIVFIHGNSDSALKFGENPFQSGWDDVLAHFIAKGYSLSELYGITYGDRNISNSYTRNFNCNDLMLHRRFIESVLQYTHSSEVHLIAHSMGVSIARRVIQGGVISTPDGACDIGPNFSDRVATLISLSSANYGMCACQHASAFPACGMTTGFYPGTCFSYECQSENNTVNECPNMFYSKFLKDLNSCETKDAKFIASLWSEDDEIIGKGNLVWGRYTSLVPHSDIQKVYQNLTHNDVKLLTAEDQYNIIQQNEIQLKLKKSNFFMY